MSDTVVNRKIRLVGKELHRMVDMLIPLTTKAKVVENQDPRDTDILEYGERLFGGK